MSEIVNCPGSGCNGGFVLIPKVGYDSKGEPITYQDMVTCIICNGRGTVER